MQVKSIAECSKGSILQYFRPSLIYHLSLISLFCLFLSGCLRQVYCTYLLKVATALAAFFFWLALGAAEDGDLKLVLELCDAGDFSDDCDDDLDNERLDGINSESLSFTTCLPFLNKRLRSMGIV